MGSRRPGAQWMYTSELFPRRCVSRRLEPMKTVVSVRLPSDLTAKIDRQAEARELTRSRLLRALLQALIQDGDDR